MVQLHHAQTYGERRIGRMASKVSQNRGLNKGEIHFYILLYELLCEAIRVWKEVHKSKDRLLFFLPGGGGVTQEQIIS